MTVELTTDRLILRQPVTENYEALYHLTEPAAMRVHLGIDNPNRADSYARMLRNVGSWTLYGYGVFMVHEAESGDFIGTCGLFPSYRGLGEDFDDKPEAGWIIAEAHWGKGYAVEALSAAIDWFEAAHGAQRTVCMISPGNIASVRVASRLGYTYYATRDHMGSPIDLFERG